MSATPPSSPLLVSYFKLRRVLVAGLAMGLTVTAVALYGGATAAPPATPTGLVAKPSAGSVIALTWKSSTPAARTLVLRNGAQIADLDPGATSFLDTSATYGTSYVYGLKAKSATTSDTSAASASVAATLTLKDFAGPAATDILKVKAPAAGGSLRLNGDPRLLDIGLASNLISDSVNAADNGVRVLLPENYDPNRAQPYPVLYLLHGMSIPGMTNGGRKMYTSESASFHTTQQSLQNEFDNAQKSIPAAQRGVIVVTPEGGDHGWYTNWKDGTQNKWKTYHLKQLIPWIDANFHTNATPAGRAIAGYSMGGYGAMRYAEDIDNPTKKSLFSSVTSMSGVLNTQSGINLAKLEFPLALAPMYGGFLEESKRPRCLDGRIAGPTLAGWCVVGTRPALVGIGDIFGSPQGFAAENAVNPANVKNLADSGVRVHLSTTRLGADTTMQAAMTKLGTAFSTCMANPLDLKTCLGAFTQLGQDAAMGPNGIIQWLVQSSVAGASDSMAQALKPVKGAPAASYSHDDWGSTVAYSRGMDPMYQCTGGHALCALFEMHQELPRIINDLFPGANLTEPSAN